MWNRVFLLATGLAAGWSLVTYLVAAESQRVARRTRLVLSLVAGLVLLALLASSSALAAFQGLLVFLFSAAVAYMAHARDLTASDPVEIAQPQAEAETDAPVLLLVNEGESASYAGPKPWECRMALAERRGAPLPHWLRRPFALARLREACRQTPQEHTLDHTAEHLAHWLTEHSPYAVRSSQLCGVDNLDATVEALRSAGALVGIVALWMDAEALQALSDRIESNGDSEPAWLVGRLAPPAPPAPSPHERLLRLLADKPLGDPDVHIEQSGQQILAQIEGSTVRRG